MNKAPYYTPEMQRYRDRATSERQNKMMDSLMYDITDLFNRANLNEKEIIMLQERFEVSEHYREETYDEIRAEIVKLKQEIESLQKPGILYNKTYYPQEMNTKDAIDESERALLDKQHDLIMLPYSLFSSSKLFMFDNINNEYIIPRQLKYSVTPAADGISIRENDFLDAVTPDNSRIWLRTHEFFAGLKNEVEATIVLKLPEDVILANDINTIFLHPFPLNSIDIMNVEFRMNGGWATIPGFQPVEKAGNSKFCFPNLEAQEIRVTLRQRHYMEKSGRQIFHIGLRELGVYNNDYQTGVGRFNIPMKLNKTFVNKEILEIKPIFQNASALFNDDNRLVTFKVYEVKDDGTESYISDTLPIRTSSNNLVLKGSVLFDNHNRITPTIKRVEVSYKGDA